MHPHNLSHLTLRICISRGVRHTSQRSATSPSPFIIILLEFFFSNPPSILPFPPPSKKKKKKGTLRTHCDFSSQAQPFALILLFLFVSRVCSMVMPFFILLCFILSLSPRIGTGDDQRGDETEKKKKERKRKGGSTFRMETEWSGIKTEIAMIVSLSSILSSSTGYCYCYK